MCRRRLGIAVGGEAWSDRRSIRRGAPDAQGATGAEPQKTIAGPFRVGSGLRWARWNAGGAMPSERSAPVPIEGWSG